MKNSTSKKMFLFLSVLLLLAAPAYASGPHEEDGRHEGEKHEEEHKEGEHEEETIHLSEDQLATAELGIRRAEAGTITPSLSVFGLIRPNQEKLVHIVPRFSGVVLDVKRRLGERVDEGDALAVMESNESLRAYTLRAPSSGQIVQWNVAPGQYAGTSDTLMVIADLSSVWLDMQVHTHDADLIREGQAVTFEGRMNEKPVTSKISYVSPIAAQDTQSLLARAVVPNVEGHLKPGLYVTAKVSLQPAEASVVIARSAVQYEGADPIIYVPAGEGEFEERRITIGRTDDAHAEILGGLASGEAYVAENAFILKAEAGKNAASHAH
ncbi:efflux RND transporter periplasmic adaptor subunit [Tepidicaulis sp.]|jgi:cobalt-zinc-cadmium efflux system membrane fusion protein|uniref:efflux RND transporter periplasmic adaptor subunit n=1 Tax=unclassified Tepidicaulis TaxID=2625293 RepID=UPI000EF91170